MHRFTLRLKLELYNKILKYAKNNNINVSEVIRLAIEKFLGDK